MARSFDTCYFSDCYRLVDCKIIVNIRAVYEEDFNRDSMVRKWFAHFEGSVFYLDDPTFLTSDVNTGSDTNDRSVVSALLVSEKVVSKETLESIRSLVR